MARLAVLWMATAGMAAAPPPDTALARFEFEQVEMAASIRLVLYATDEGTANRAAEAAFARVRQLNGVLSDYDPASELRRLCRTSSEGRPVAVSDDLWRVLRRAQQTAEQSEGAFDVTVGPVVRLWRRARTRRQLPSPERMKTARQKVGYKLVRLHPENQSVELLEPDMLLDLGGIAKGFAADEALAALRKHGITRALVDAGGDVVLGDPPPDRPAWRIGVAPLDDDAPPSQFLALANVAVATSGDAWQHVVIDGVRYSHIIDPRTGMALTDHSSVTVIARDGTTADALASAVSVLGPEKGTALVDKTCGAAAFIVRAPEGKVQTYQSSAWKDVPSVDADQSKAKQE